MTLPFDDRLQVFQILFLQDISFIFCLPVVLKMAIAMLNRYFVAEGLHDYSGSPQRSEDYKRKARTTAER
jgi:hypothetical protein